MIDKEYLDENEAAYYMKQILSAMDFCHKKKIVHLDLKVLICNMNTKLEEQRESLFLVQLW